MNEIEPENTSADPSDRYPAMLTSKQAAEYLLVPEQTLRLWRVQREGPPWIKLGRLVRYSMDDLQLWLAKNRKDPDSLGLQDCPGRQPP